MITDRKGSTGTATLRSALIMKLFLENPNKNYLITDIQEYLKRYNIKAHGHSVSTILYFLSSVIDIQEELTHSHRGERKYYIYKPESDR